MSVIFIINKNKYIFAAGPRGEQQYVRGDADAGPQETEAGHGVLTAAAAVCEAATDLIWEQWLQAWDRSYLQKVSVEKPWSNNNTMEEGCCVQGRQQKHEE